jgi:hypothetical protein
MSVSITLPGALEQFLQTQAQHMGVPIETLLTRTIIERWDNLRRDRGLPPRETELLLRLQTLFSPEQTREYLALREQSDAGTLTEFDRERLLNLIEQRDHQNAERLAIVAEFAGIRGISLRETMAQLGIRPE